VCRDLVERDTGDEQRDADEVLPGGELAQRDCADCRVEGGYKPASG
jgi:hypothetical protein